MHSKAAFVFWLTLILYIATLVTVTYVGVYLTYVTIPIIVISGLIMKLTKPTPEYSKTMNEIKATTKEVGKVTESALNGVSGVLSSFNRELEMLNETLELKMERTKDLKNLKTEVEIKRLKIDEKYDELLSEESKEKTKLLRKTLDSELALIEREIDKVKLECEREVEQKYN